VRVLPPNGRYYYIFCFLLILVFCQPALSQVAIGTTNPDDGSAFQIDSKVGALVPPRMTNSEMLAIPSPLDGSIVYNNTFSSLFLYSSGTWNDLTRPDLPSAVLRREYPSESTNGIVATGNNTYYNFPLNTADVTSIDNSYFQITGNGTLRILEGGNYMVSSGFAVSNLPSGNRKYIIGVYRNNSLIGYLVRGNVNFPSGTNEWGTSGVLVFSFNANDVVSLRYVLNNSGTSLNARYFNIGIVKL